MDMFNQLFGGCGFKQTNFKHKERIYENVRLQQYKLSQILTEKTGVNHVFPFSH